jgi:hypothetical protein
MIVYNPGAIKGNEHITAISGVENGSVKLQIYRLYTLPIYFRVIARFPDRRAGTIQYQSIEASLNNKSSIFYKAQVKPDFWGGLAVRLDEIIEWLERLSGINGSRRCDGLGRLNP